MDSRIFAMSDIHGNFDLLKKMLDKIQFNNNDTLYIIGDICDRGADSLSIFFYIWEHPNIILLKGNHEYMMQVALKLAVEHNDFDYPSCEFNLWQKNGGNTTIDNIREYLKKQVLQHDDYTIVRSLFLKRLYNYLASLPLKKELNVNGKDFVLVHAGVDPERSLSEQEEDTLLWIRDYFYLSKCEKDKTYIFGHTPATFINRDHSCNVWYDDQFHNKVCIDGGLAIGRVVGQLNCLCLNDMQEFIVRAGE